MRAVGGESPAGQSAGQFCQRGRTTKNACGFISLRCRFQIFIVLLPMCCVAIVHVDCVQIASLLDMFSFNSCVGTHRFDNSRAAGGDSPAHSRFAPARPHHDFSSMVEAQAATSCAITSARGGNSEGAHSSAFFGCKASIANGRQANGFSQT